MNKWLNGPKYRLVEEKGEFALYLATYNVRIATFSLGTEIDAQHIVEAANRWVPVK